MLRLSSAYKDKLSGYPNYSSPSSLDAAFIFHSYKKIHIMLKVE